MDNQYISVREAAQTLGVSEKKIMDLIEDGSLKAYKIANQFLRLKKSEVGSLQQTGSVENEVVSFPYTPRERVADFFYYNHFYLISMAVILGLIYIVLAY